jgi:hypothetical protein
MQSLRSPRLTSFTGAVPKSGAEQLRLKDAEASKVVERLPADSQRLPMHRRFRNLSVFVLAKHSSGRRIDQVNTSADGARHDLIGTIGSSYTGVALHAKPRVGAAVCAVHEGRHNKGIMTAALVRTVAPSIKLL